MEECSGKLSKFSRARYFYFLAGFCLATFLTIVYTGNWPSSKADITPTLQISRLTGDEVKAFVSRDRKNRLELQQSNAGGYPVFDDRANEWMDEYEDNVTLLDGTYRDSPNGGRKLKRMVSQRTKDNYTHCSGIAPFVGPYSYLKEAKNPCWYEGNDLRCVPYFLLAGFSKSGTSDLFGRLSHHPQVSSTKKEKHWLDYLRYFKNKDSIEFYSDLFRKTTERIEDEIEVNGYSNLITGDGTPCYAWFNFYWRCYEGNQGLESPKVTNADVLYRLNPKVKIIMMLRNPVSRLYSRYLTWLGKVNHKAYNKPGPAAFHALVTNAISLFNKCVQRWSLRHCAFNGTLYTQMTLRLQEGMYSVFIQDWLRVFPRDQILVLRFEDYVIDISTNLRKVFHFLNLDQLSSFQLNDIVMEKKRNSGKHYDVGLMWNSTKKVLEDFYFLINKDLPDLLGDKGVQWTT